MTKKLQKLRDKDPYASERTTSDRRFWATFQQDYYATVIIKKPKITHMAQYVDWTYSLCPKKNVILGILGQIIKEVK
jgi:hypothetical protein